MLNAKRLFAHISFAIAFAVCRVVIAIAVRVRDVGLLFLAFAVAGVILNRAAILNEVHSRRMARFEWQFSLIAVSLVTLALGWFGGHFMVAIAVY